MKFIQLQPMMSNKFRIATPKEKVNGWKHTVACGLHFFKRGNIGYILTPDNKNGAKIEKFDYQNHKYLTLSDYSEFTKFYDIQVVNE